MSVFADHLAHVAHDEELVDDRSLDVLEVEVRFAGIAVDVEDAKERAETGVLVRRSTPSSWGTEDSDLLE